MLVAVADASSCIDVRGVEQDHRHAAFRVPCVNQDWMGLGRTHQALGVDEVTSDPIARQTISAQVRRQLLRRIITGEMMPGSRVPSEQELSEKFQVARTSVREAIQGLLAVGAIERRGNRTCVAEFLPDVLVRAGNGEKPIVEQLFETRRLLEVPIFVLAAERSDRGDHAIVRALLDRFDEPLSLGGFRQLNREFHTIIASACGNPVVAELYRKVFNQLLQTAEFEAMVGDERMKTVMQRAVAEAIDGHREIGSAFVDNDPIAMKRAVVGHLDTVGRVLVLCWDPHPPLHPLRLTRMQVPCRPTRTTRPLLAMDPQDRWQDRHPPPHKLYREWINNDRRVRRIIDQMRAVAAKAAEIRLTQTDSEV